MRWMTHRDTGAFRRCAPSRRQPPKPFPTSSGCSQHSTMARHQYPYSHSRVWQPASCPVCARFQMRSRRFRDSGGRRPRGVAARREAAREADQSRLGAVAAWIAMGPACAGKLLVGLLQSEAAASVRLGVGAVHIEHGAVHIEHGAQARRSVPAIVPLQATLPACHWLPVPSSLPLRVRLVVGAGGGCRRWHDEQAGDGRPSRSPRLPPALSILAAGGRHPCPSLRLEDLGSGRVRSRAGRSGCQLQA